jgi:hypothetical protein
MLIYQFDPSKFLMHVHSPSGNQVANCLVDCLESRHTFVRHDCLDDESMRTYTCGDSKGDAWCYKKDFSHKGVLDFGLLQKCFHQARRTLSFLALWLCLTDIWRALFGHMHSLGSMLEEEHLWR